jgi:NRPS condensation-like uncharacterized protein
MPAPTAVAHEFDAGQFKVIRANAKLLGGTLNDYLLWNVFRALAEWSRRHGQPRAPTLRVGMPVNMRQPEDEDVPACNIVSMYFLDRKGDALSDEAALHRSIVEETERVKRHQLGLAFWRLLRTCGAVPGGLAVMLARKPLLSNCVNTVTLSNLGLVLATSPIMHEDGKVRAGSLTLTRIELLPPFRHMTHGSFGVASYDGRMSVAFHYDPRFLAHEVANAFLQVFVKQTAR